MKNETLNYNDLWDILLKIVHLLERPVVQFQILVIATAILLAWLLSKGLWIWLTRRFPQLKNLSWSHTKLSWKKYGSTLLQYLLTPGLSLLLINLFRRWFVQQGWVAGLLTDALGIMTIYLFYRFFLVLLYATFPANSVTRYRNRFFAPLLFFIIASNILSLIIDLQQLSQLVLLNMFGSPVTLGAIFVMTVGLYFWITGVSVLERLLVRIFLTDSSEEWGTEQAFLIILHYLLMGLGIVLILGYVGFNTTALAAITGGLSIGIGFGLKEVISNFVSGIWLLFEGALKPGDVIDIEGDMSQVKKLGVRATKVQSTRDNSEKIIPNQNFFTQSVTTYTGSDRLVYRSLKVGASYNSNPQEVIEILLKVAKQHPKVLEYPVARAFFIGFGESSLDFELKFWLDDPLIGKTVTSEIGCAIWKAFAANGIEIPYPQRDLHLRA
jgi:small-conductance mechanosensitive channel